MWAVVDRKAFGGVSANVNGGYQGRIRVAAASPGSVPGHVGEK
jgi:hypothetical protein